MIVAALVTTDVGQYPSPNKPPPTNAPRPSKPGSKYEGISGVSTRLAERPEGKRLFDILRAGDTLVVRWVDRLGRNYTDVVDTIREFMRRGVVIKTVINGMTFDGSTTDPMQQAVRNALITFMAATAQAQAEATKSAQRAGIDHSRMVKHNAYLGGKPSYDRAALTANKRTSGCH